MLDVAPTELLLVAIVALLVIGPKELPKAMRIVGYWIGKARGVARQFRSGFDSMVREAELAEMEKKWAEENARIMREHPADPSPSPSLASEGEARDDETPHARSDEALDQPVTVEKPVVAPALEDHPPVAVDKAPS